MHSVQRLEVPQIRLKIDVKGFFPPATRSCFGVVALKKLHFMHAYTTFRVCVDIQRPQLLLLLTWQSWKQTQKSPVSRALARQNLL